MGDDAKSLVARDYLDHYVISICAVQKGTLFQPVLTDFSQEIFNVKTKGMLLTLKIVTSWL